MKVRTLHSSGTVPLEQTSASFSKCFEKDVLKVILKNNFFKHQSRNYSKCKKKFNLKKVTVQDTFQMYVEKMEGKYLDQLKGHILMNSFFKSQLNYCLLI